MHIDYKEVRKVPIESVLRQRGVEYKRQGVMLVAKQCPLPSHTSKETSTFKASLQTNLWTCHSTSCRNASRSDGGDVIDLVMIMDGLRPLEAAKKLVGDGIETNGRKSETPAPSTSKKEFFAEAIADAVNRPLKFRLDCDPEHPAIQSRGISVETARSYGVGFYRSKQGTASMDGRIIFPLIEDGELIGYAGRTVSEVTPENPKWKMPRGLLKSFLFGLERCEPSKPLVIVESPWTVLELHQEGYGAASLLGCSMTDMQEKRLDAFHSLYVCMDDDEPGREASVKLEARLKKKHGIYRACWKG